MNDYKERFVNEYNELKERRTKLYNMLVKYKNGMLDFEPTSSFDILMKQYIVMTEYQKTLEERSILEAIFLEV